MELANARFEPVLIRREVQLLRRQRAAGWCPRDAIARAESAR
jgi:hypothetical protein